MMPENVNLYSQITVDPLPDTGDMDLPVHGDHQHNGQVHGVVQKKHNYFFIFKSSAIPCGW
jgi:hypothetical protein